MKDWQGLENESVQFGVMSKFVPYRKTLLESAVDSLVTCTDRGLQFLIGGMLHRSLIFHYFITNFKILKIFIPLAVFGKEKAEYV